MERYTKPEVHLPKTEAFEEAINALMELPSDNLINIMNNFESESRGYHVLLAEEALYDRQGNMTVCFTPSLEFVKGRDPRFMLVAQLVNNYDGNQAAEAVMLELRATDTGGRLLPLVSLGEDEERRKTEILARYVDIVRLRCSDPEEKWMATVIAPGQDEEIIELLLS